MSKNDKKDNAIKESYNPYSKFADTYVDVPNLLSPRESLLRLQAGGMLSDIRQKRKVYSEKELDEYITAEYAVDYIQEYNDFKRRKLEEMQNRHLEKKEIDENAIKENKVNENVENKD